MIFELKRTARISVIYIAFIIIMLAIFPCISTAQNNKFKIDDRLYPLYKRADFYRQTELGLHIADTLYDEARRIGDKKAECLACTIPLNYFFYKKDFVGMENARERLCTISRANGYLQYYYWAYRMNIIAFVNANRYFEAMQLAEKARLQAEADHHAFGIFIMMHVIGDLYQVQGDDDTAADYYREALNYQQVYLPEQDPTAICIALAEYHRKKYNRTPQDIEHANEYIEIGLKNVKHDRSRARLICEKAMLLYSENKIIDFMRLVNENWSQIVRENLDTVQLACRKYLVQGNYDAALKLTDSVKLSYERSMTRYLIFKTEGDFAEALAEYEYAQYVKDNAMSIERQNNLAGMSSQFDNYNLKIENARLESEASKMEAKAAEAELKKAQTQMLLNQKNMEFQLMENQMKLNEMEAERQEQQAQMELQKERIRSERANKKVLMLVIFAIGITLLYVLFEWVRTRLNTRRLRAKNEELAIARDRAVQSEKVKTAFIQNMSHEIRTPLNAIVGFSQLLAAPDMKLEPSETQEFCKLISHNSDLLVTLVGDILTLSDLDSNYDVKLSELRINDLCRSAIAFAHNKVKEGVALDFVTSIPDDYTILSDESLIMKVFDNLFTNAGKFTQEGSITLGCSIVESESYESVSFSVTDTGPGIPEDKREEIFERFAKLDYFQQGAGLGLSICVAIMKRLQGRIYVDPDYSGGARFVFQLPANIPAAKNA